MRIVIVSPHRDDAAFSLALSVAAWLQAGHQVHVLNCFTQSAYAPFSDAESLHANDRVSFVSATRRREDAAWNKRVGGRLRITDLDLLDAPLRLACGVEEVLTMEIRPGDRAVARIAGAVRKIADASRAGELAVLVPSAVVGHIDHRVVRMAGESASKGRYLPMAFYEDLPYAAWLRDEAEFVGAVRAGEGFEAVFPAEPAADVEAAIREKRRVAELYDSQIDSEMAGLIAEFARRYGGRERIWANAAWRELETLCPQAPVGAILAEASR